MNTSNQLLSQTLPYCELNSKIVELCTHSRIDSPHYHSEGQLWYTLEGCYQFAVNKTEYTLPRGSLLFIPPYAPHFINTLDFPSKKLVRCTINIKDYNDICTTKESPVPLLSFNDFGLYVDGEPHIMATQLSEDDMNKADVLFNDLIKMQNENISKETILRVINSIMHFLPKSDAPKLTKSKLSTLSEKFNTITDIVTYIFDNFSKQINSDDMHKKAMMSRAVFFRSFQMITGVTFVTFLNSFRVRKAQSQLTYTDTKLDAIAAECGFAHQSHMIHTFKRSTSHTPTEYKFLSRDWYQKYRPEILQKKMLHKDSDED